MRGAWWPAGMRVVDDRGRPIPAIDVDQRSAQVWETRRTAWRWLLSVVGYLWIAGFVGYHMWFGVPWKLRAILMGVAFWMLALIGAFVSASLGSVRARARVHASVAWLNAHRCCGACGYSLREVEPGVDGMAVCPECGAAWHQDRWTMADRDLKEASELRKVVESPLATMKIEAWDDRYVPVTMAPASRAGLLDADWIPERDRLRVRRELARRRAWHIGIASVVIAAAWAGGVCFTMWIKDPLPRDRTEILVSIAIVYGLIGLTLLYAVSRIAVSWMKVRAAWLRVGRCPGCGEGLPNVAGEFDGCVACSRCKRSWRLPMLVERGAGNRICASSEIS